MAKKKQQQTEQQASSPVSADDPNVVLYRETELGAMVDEAERRLVENDAPLYQRQGTIAHVYRNDPLPIADELAIEFGYVDRPAILRKGGALVINQASPHFVREHVVGAAHWYKFDLRVNAWVRFAPSLEFARHVMGRAHWKHLPVLKGIAEAPTLRPDGSVLDADGLDAATGVYLDRAGVRYPKVKDRPSRADALAALGTLKDVIRGFPFVPDDGTAASPDKPSSSRSVALSLMLTGVCRKAMDNAPLHAVDAADRGTGKTLLCDTAALMAVGHEATVMAQGPSEEEFDKRVFSMLLAGDPIVVIDNIERDVESSQFCSVLTSSEYQGRILGVSEMRAVNTQVLFILNGNNIRVKGDLSVRTIMCRMDANMENPTDRKFDRDLKEWVPANRPMLVHACLTLLRAFVVAGRPGVDKLRASRAPSWDRLVRGALVWLGEPDPYNTRELTEAADPEKEALAALLKAWQNAIGEDKPMTVKEIIDLCTGQAAGTSEWPTTEEHDEVAAEALQEALTGILPPRSSFTNKSIGRALTRYNRRIVNGLKIVQQPGRLGSFYTLQNVNQAEISA